MNKEKIYQLEIKENDEAKIVNRINQYLKENLSDVEVIVAKEEDKDNLNKIKASRVEEVVLNLNEDNLEEQLEAVIKKIEKLNDEILDKNPSKNINLN
ncbi:MAG: hypothetical protein LBR40_01405 [Bacilli bacterium]|jgi:hypothetical protein|nr:hypothetical protein [Bacilli bacterium]